MKMMIIDDLTQRQEDEYCGKPLKTYYQSVLYNAIDSEFGKQEIDLRKGDFTLNYNIVAIHDSAFGDYKEEIQDKLKKYCKNNKIILIFFSGGIMNTRYEKKHERLYMNSRDFYKNLEFFLINLEKNILNLNILSYGKDWKINLLNSITKRIKNFIKINNEEKINFILFKDEIQLDLTVQHIGDFEFHIENGFINIQTIKDFQKHIQHKLNKEMNF